MLDYIWKLWSI